MGSVESKRLGRLKRKKRIRKKISGTSERPRLCVFRSSRHTYAQIVDDVAGRTLASASTLTKEITEARGAEEDESRTAGILKADVVGRAIGELALKEGVKSVVFDRSGFLYHGRVKAVADGAREAGLKF